MGLDITAYSNLAPAPGVAVDEDGYPIDGGAFVTIHAAIIQWTEGNWPGRTTGLAPGLHSYTKEHDFRAGSYGGYNHWRDALARFAGYGSAQDIWESDNPTGAFVELINFADNEGYIGPAISAKLAKDFADNEARILELAKREPFFSERYAEWRKAFELASDGGCVAFH